SFKGFTAREILREAGQSKRQWLLNQFEYFKKRHKTRSTFQVWQEGAHPQLIRDAAMFSQKAGYIHENPVRAGWVDAPEHWRYSSARNFLGLPGRVLEIDEWLV